jgi:trehalose 6-phosphate synthase
MSERLVIVSNRIADPRKPAAGGLAVAVGESLRDTGGLWFGWSGKVVDDGTNGEGELAVKRAGRVTLATVDLSAEDHKMFYLGYANNVLWPAFHYRLDLTHYDTGFVDGYRRVNALFARKLMPLLRPDDIVWVHDYHLIPLARELCEMGCTQRIGFFLHIPMPPTTIMTAVPGHDALMRSMFDYDVVGFQTNIDVDHFGDYIKRELGGHQIDNDCFEAHIGGRQRKIVARAFPISIDLEEFNELANSTESHDAEEMLQREFNPAKGQRVLIGVDRLDYSKGLPQRFAAFRQLLTRYPENRRISRLVQIASPTREDVDAYTDIRQTLESMAGSINGTFGDVDWVPIRYVNRTVARRRLPGLYRASHVGVVTPLRDGMNLVAKEYVAAQDPNDPGVLVLSRFAGAAERMRAALLVNPYDANACADAMQRALQMPLAERIERHTALMEELTHFDVKHWREDFLAELRLATLPVIKATIA